jgi:hypothetical protein
LSNDFVIDQKERLGLARRALANTQTGVTYLSLMLQDGGNAIKAEAEAALRGRFLGNQDLDTIRNLLTPATEDSATQIASLRKKLRADPDVWATRSALAGLLIDQTNYAEAARILAGYPGFNATQPENPIYLSNMAAESGHIFYWRGAEKEARQMYQIATRYQVGSEAEMTAAMRLCLLANDLEGALEQARIRVERYRNGTAYGNYLSLLHLMGRSTEAWRAFELLLKQPMGVGPWESALVGQRIAGLTQEGLDRWLAQPDINRAGTYAVSWSAAYLMMWNTTDRVAVDDLAQQIQLLNHEPRGITEGNDGRVASYPGVQKDQRFLVVRSGFGTDRRRPLKFPTAVESDMPLFARALVAFQRGDFVTAVSRYDDLAARFPIETRVENADAVYALPDFAYASAKSGDSVKLEAYLAALPPDSDFFEIWLARAYFQALTHHDDDAALQSLGQAFLWIQHYIGRKPSMEYQYADTAERLYRETADKRFRDKALTWAHEFQHLQPWSAWAYLIEAELAEDPGTRRVALVRALFLDRLSPRLKSVPDRELEAARAELAGKNPFLRPKVRNLTAAPTISRTLPLAPDG